MKNKKFLFISLLILAIGFAAVSTTLYISGNLLFGTNKNDFEVYFSGAIVDNEDKSNEVILSDKKHIEYETKELKKLGDTSVLEFEVTNNSTQYDANVSISCSLSDGEYVSYTTDKQEYEIPAQTRKSGKVTVELIKVSTNTLNPTISCELVSTAEERTSKAETVITDNLYEITGSLTDEEGNVLANKNLVVYSETPHYVTTDDYGFFYVSGLEKGSHEIYYVNEENVEGKIKEEVKGLAEEKARITTNSTSINFDNIKLNDFKINIEKEEEINITLDADSGTIDSDTIKLNKYQKGSKLPTPTPKNSNYEFLGWFAGDKKITNNTIITSKMNLIAKWNYNCPYEVGKVWNFDYTGGEQDFTVPCDGTYKLETWGAQGNADGTAQGGYGGYVASYVELEKVNTLYVVVGGMASDYSESGAHNAYGYNGGGKPSFGDGGGGGATHIAFSSGLLSSFSSNYNEELLIVAGGGGGGGGGSSWYTGKAGGIMYYDGQWHNYNSSVLHKFGEGQSGPANTRSEMNSYVSSGAYVGAGGGGGFYGGVGGISSNGGTNYSGYGGASYFNSKYGTASFQSGARSGNGYAKITLVSID